MIETLEPKVESSHEPALEERIDNILHLLGKAMMEWKVHEWNSSVSRDDCSDCGSNLHNRMRTRQILTTVATIDYERYMSNCPKCSHTEYPLDEVLGIQPFQRMSSTVQELAVLCGASWDYCVCQPENGSSALFVKMLD